MNGSRVYWRRPTRDWGERDDGIREGLIVQGVMTVWPVRNVLQGGIVANISRTLDNANHTAVARTAHAKHMRRVRKNAQRNIRALLAAQRYRCYWCFVRIINVQAINKSRNRRVTGFFVRYTVRGVDYKVAKATVDHLVPLSKNGTNDIDNLVAACAQCNHRRKDGIAPVKQCKMTPLFGHIGELQRNAVLGL